MFPRLREQIGTALDLIVEFSTLGEYRLGVDCGQGAYRLGPDHAHGAPSAPAAAPGHMPQLGGGGDRAARAADRRIVAGGPAGYTPVATPAARRLSGEWFLPRPCARPVAAARPARTATAERGSHEAPLCSTSRAPRRAQRTRRAAGGALAAPD